MHARHQNRLADEVVHKANESSMLGITIATQQKRYVDLTDVGFMLDQRRGRWSNV